MKQPMRRVELVINLKTAKALGLTFPQSILLQATELIQSIAFRVRERNLP